jgi:hypothetical protein
VLAVQNKKAPYTAVSIMTPSCLMLKDGGAPLYPPCDALLSLESPSSYSSRWFPDETQEATGVVNGQDVCSGSACVSHPSRLLDQSWALGLVSSNASVRLDLFEETVLPTTPFRIDGGLAARLPIGRAVLGALLYWGLLRRVDDLGACLYASSKAS